MSRFYTNPFVKDAPIATLLEKGELEYHCDGQICTWHRTYKYSDGSTRRVLEKQMDIYDRIYPAERRHRYGGK